VKVEFLHKQRDEAKYDGLPALIRQIEIDCAQARAYLATNVATNTGSERPDVMPQ